MKEKIEEIIADVFLNSIEDGYLDRRASREATYQILSLFPSLKNIEVTEECENCKLEFQAGRDNDDSGSCKYCRGVTKVTREATWEDIDIVGMVEYLGRLLPNFIVPPINTKSGGILRVKGE